MQSCCFPYRLQNSPYFCVFKYAQAVKQKVSNKAENRERDYTHPKNTQVTPPPPRAGTTGWEGNQKINFSQIRPAP